MNAFIRNIESTAHSFGWNDVQIAIYGRRFVGGTAKSLLRAANVQTWNDICRESLAEFGSTMNIDAVHRMLATRKKQNNETMQQYSIAMRQIASATSIDEETLVNYIVDGISIDNSVRSYFASATSLNGLRALISRFNEPKECGDNVVRANNNNNFQPNNNSGVRCYHCGDLGHFASNCRKTRRPVCFTCNQEGHFQSRCPKNKHQQQQQAANIDYDNRFERPVYWRTPN